MSSFESGKAQLPSERSPKRPEKRSFKKMYRTTSPLTFRRKRNLFNQRSGHIGFEMLKSIPAAELTTHRGITPRIIRGRLFENSFRAKAEKLQVRRLRAMKDFSNLFHVAKSSTILT